ncbi:amino acid adenylation domain-containing protein [Sporosarcina sp. FSL W8-0480]|uniref:amino acid adenylation domain-containing protein n=1 Tax=Sporosarcina sp. FSL W8-0480 TaxID=2954701 RepID=UPI0030DAF8D0
MSTHNLNNNIEKVYSLSPLQEGMLFHQIVNEKSGNYVVQTSLKIKGDFSVELANESIQLLAQKHEVLRTMIPLNRFKKPVQIVLKDRQIEFTKLDLQELSGVEQEVEVEKFLEQDVKRGFDFEKSTNFRVAAIRLSKGEWILVWSFHHIIIDGWCLPILFEDFLNNYFALQKGESKENIMSAIKNSNRSKTTYGDYIKWLQMKDEEEGYTYWDNLLHGYDTNAKIQSFGNKEITDSSVLEFSIPFTETEFNIVKERMVAYNVTISTLIETAWGVVLQSYSGSNDVVFGKVVSGRDISLPNIEETVGLFINTIPTRVEATDEISCMELLHNMQNQGANSLDYQHSSLAEIQSRSMNKGLIHSVYAFENFVTNEGILSEKEGLSFEISKAREQTNYPLTLRVSHLDTLQLDLLYDPSLFSENDIRRILLQLKKTVLHFALHPDSKVESINSITDEEEAMIIREFNHSTGNYDEFSVSALFEEMATKFPDKTALRFGDKGMSYDELNKRANAMAHTLIELGVEKEEPVIIYGERSLELLVGIMGILKAGASYVPIDHTYPKERIDFIVEDVGARIALLGDFYYDFKQDLIRVNLKDNKSYNNVDTNPNITVDGTHLAYIMYTSGTSGKPKGSLIEHKSIIRLVKDANYVAFNENTRILQTGSIAFDASTFEFFGSLLNGGTLYLEPNETLTDVNKLSKSLKENKINTLWMTSSLFNQMLDIKADMFENLDHLLVGGEKLSVNHIRKFKSMYPDVKIINGYGPTENTTFTTTYEIPTDFDTIPIGKPISGTQVYVMNSDKLCGIGIPGELCITGTGVSRGYLNRDELTNEKFVDNPFGEGKMYRSGDLVRWLPDGNIEYLGRIDQQVKIRGYRVELQEIEEVFNKQDGVKETVVIAKEVLDGDKALFAYVVMEEGEDVNLAVIKESLRKELPEYMIPSYIMAINEIPLTVNGKMDTKALPDIEWERPVEYIAPRNPVEETICNIYEEVFGIQQVSVTDNFFELGGHSLRAMNVVLLLEEKLKKRIEMNHIFDCPTPELLSKRIEEMEVGNYEPIPIAEHKDSYLMSSAQKRLFLLNQMNEAELSYNMPACLSYTGKMDEEKVQNVLNELVQRHESLRTSFHFEDGEAVQRIAAAASIKVEREERDASSSSEVYLKEFVRPFDLSKAPLLRIKIIKTKDDEGYLLFDMHHIITDGMSMNILIKEFCQLYEGKELTSLTVQYKDYSEWMSNRDFNGQQNYWLDIYAEKPTVLDFPLDAKRPQLQSFKGKSVKKLLSKNATEELKAFARREGYTDYMVMLGALMVCVGKYSRQEDIIIGSSISGRTHPDATSIVGMFVNTLAMRGYPEKGKSVKAFLDEVKEHSLNSYENQEYPFEDLVERIVTNRDLSRNPIFDIMFTLQNNEEVLFETKDFTLGTIGHQTVVKFDLDFHVKYSDGHYQLDLIYSEALFNKESMEILVEHYFHILNEIIVSPNKMIGELKLSNETDTLNILMEFNNTDNLIDTKQTVKELFEEVVEKYPEKIALVDGLNELSYEELNNKINYLTNNLRELGIQPGERVAILTNRSAAMIVGIYAVIKAGGSYIPIDPDYPLERKKYVIEDSAPKVILVGDSELSALGELGTVDSTILNLDDEFTASGHQVANPPRVHHENDLVYIMYTSGTTGKPKGVMVKHSNLYNYLQYGKKSYVTEEVCAPLFTSFGFDLTVTTLFLPLCTGGKLVIEDHDVEKTIKEIFHEDKYSFAKMTPSHLKMAIQEQPKQLKKLNTLIVGGEELSVQLTQEILDKFGSHIKIHNEYGPTEATVGCCDYVYTGSNKGSVQGTAVSIGKAIDNTKIYIMDQDKLCSINVPGELCIAGAGVSAGYFNQEELTKEKFVQNPFGEGVLYRTGDLARWLPNGQLEYLGRIDEQTSIRGYRIEPGEIEEVLGRQEGIKDAVVIVKETGEDKLLTAFVVPKNGIGLDLTKVKRDLRKELPSFMIPSFVAEIEEIPLTINGKVDKNALQEIEYERQDEYVAPRNPVEEMLCSIFEEVLSIEQVGVTDNFFELGGHSLRAMGVVNLIEERMEKRIGFKYIFENPTPELLSKYVMELEGNAYEPIPKAAYKESYPMSSVQQRLFLIHQLDKADVSYNMPLCLTYEGSLDEDKVEQALIKLVDRHESFRTSFHYEEGEFIQRISLNSEIPLEMSEGVNDASPEVYLKDFVRPFDLTEAPLLRAKIIKVNQNQGYLLFDMHHIISDGMSMNIMVNDFSQFYEGKELQALTIHYKDYSEWMLNKDLKKQEDYWLAIHDKAPLASDFPLDFNRPQTPTFEGGSLKKSIGKEMTKEIKSFSRRKGYTDYMVFLSALMISVSKYSRQEDIIIGSPISGRTHADTENIVGMFVNTLAMRGYPEKDKLTNDFLDEVKEHCLTAYENQEYPFEKLVENVVENRELNRNPLFDIMLTLQNNEEAKFSIDGISISNWTEGELSVKCDLDIDVYEQNGEFIVNCTYGKELFTPESIEYFLEHYSFMIKEIIKNPGKVIGHLNLIDEKEQEMVVKQFNQSESLDEMYSSETIIEHFERQVVKTPDNIALVFEDEELTYDELNRKANSLSHKLRELGVGRNDIVAILSERNLEMMVGIYGVMKSGGAYGPIDTSFPKDRINFILNDYSPKVILLGKGVDAPEGDYVCLHLFSEDAYSGCEENPVKINEKEDLIYLTSTSGTSGKPKSVMVEHAGVTSYVRSFADEFNISEETVALQHTAYNFDTIVEEVYPAHIRGGKVVLYNEERITDINKACDYMDGHEVTLISCSTLLLKEFNQGRIPKTVNLYLNGGDTLKYSYIDNLLKHSNVGNTFGSTEETVCAAFYQVPKNQTSTIPAGKPIVGRNAYILQGEQLCGIGVPGELCITGSGVSRGYLNSEELTKEKFVDNPFGEGKMYRSGDLVRWLPDGNIEYLGRIDQQVKIRGYRVELQEIEEVFNKQQGIKETVVIAKEIGEGDQALFAYVVMEEENATDIASVKAGVRNELPEYMIPAYIMAIEEIPLTVNGKTDKKALPDIEWVRHEEYIAPKNPVEEAVCKIFEKVLGIPQVGVTDNFFELGGHSLRAMNVVNQLEEKLNKRIGIKYLFEYPTPESLSKHIEEMEAGNYEPIPKAGNKETYPMSSAQKRLFLLNQMNESEIGYNMPICLSYTGKVDVEKVQNVLDRLVQRHESLRTSFHFEEEVAVQKIAAEAAIEVDIEERDANLPSEVYLEEFVRPFDLSKAPLLRVKIIKTEDDQGYLLFDKHHIISDGMSMNILIQEFCQLYEGNELPSLNVHYKDYSEWMLNRDLAEQQNYWLSTHKEKPPVLDFPLDAKRPQLQSFKGDRVKKQLAKEVTEELKMFARREGYTDYMVMLGALMVCISKYSRQEDVVIGSPISGRTHPDTANIVGMFVNTLAMRGYPEKDKSIKVLLDEIKEHSLSSYEHQEYPFEDLVERTVTNRDFSRNPIFDIMFTLQNNEEVIFGTKDFTLGTVSQKPVAKFDLDFQMEYGDGHYHLDLIYSEAIFNKSSMKILVEHYFHILNEIIANPEKTIGEVALFDEAATLNMLKDFNNTEKIIDTQQTVKELFEEAVEVNPEKIALVDGKNELSYSELNNKINHLANKLVDLGIKPGERVAILTNRSAAMIVGIYAVIKAGGSYIPIDPDYPLERKKYVVDDSAPKVILVGDSELSSLRELGTVNSTILNLDEEFTVSGHQVANPPRLHHENDLVYIMYTSGTTGKPKGVMVKHSNLYNYLQYGKGSYVTDEVCAPLFTSVGFDLTVTTLFLPLCTGGKLVIQQQDVEKTIKEIFQDDKYSFAKMTPSHLQMAIQEQPKQLRKLNTLIVGGEELSVQLAQDILDKFGSHIKIHNEYGPTEATVGCCDYVYSGLGQGTAVSIGKAINNTQIYIMDQDKLCAINVPGELCIAGAGVSEGYFNQEELTKEKFVENPFGKGILYRTGDLARWLPNGELEYLGRIDEQTSIRGYRIEPGEIEDALRKQEGIQDAVVIAKEYRGDKTLSAFVVPKNGLKIDLSEVKGELRKELPSYMIPSFVMEIDEIPLTINGKIDKDSLSEIEYERQDEYVAPRTPVEEMLCSIFEEVLDIEQVGVTDNFFELGGDSIKAIRVVPKVREFGYEITIADIMRLQSVESIVSEVKEITVHYEQGEVNGEIDLSPIQKRFIEWNLMNRNHYNQAVMLKSKTALSAFAIRDVLDVLLKTHDMLRVVLKDDHQVILPSEMNRKFILQEFDCTNWVNLERRIEEESTMIQRTMDLEHGPLVKAALFKTKDCDYLMIAIHHFIIDGVSWRILLEDFATAYGQAVENEAIVLPNKTASYKQWTNALKEYLNSTSFIGESNYWEKVYSHIPAGQLESETNLSFNGLGYESFTLDSETTKKLIYESFNAYGTDVNDLLITSLMVALKKWKGVDEVTVDLESHGRNDVVSNIHLDRTIGWFTSIYPVHLRSFDTMKESIVETKEMLRKVPNLGIGYSLWKQQKPTERNLNSSIAFNYMGDMDLVMNDDKEHEFEMSSISPGVTSDERNELPYDISIDIQKSDEKLYGYISYKENKFTKESMEAFCKLYTESLLEVIEHCITQKEVVATPSDFDAVDMGVEELEDILNIFS